MTMIVWPPDLPSSLMAGATYDPGEPPLRTRMDAGPAKIRARTTLRVPTWRGELALSGAQIGLLDAFWADTLGHGALPFLWSDPRTGQEVLARFVDQPTARHFEADRWRASVSIEILPAVTDPA